MFESIFMAPLDLEDDLKKKAIHREVFQTS